jgi:hypothetical protein
MEGQPIRKVVDLRIRNLINFSLHFYDFFLNCYRISNSTAKITKGVLIGTIHLSLGFADNPLGFCIFQPEVPGRGQRGRRGVDRPVPATAIAGGEGGGAGKHHKVLAHLWTLGIGSGWTVEAA